MKAVFLVVVIAMVLAATPVQSQSAFQTLFNKMDINRDGIVTIDELATFWELSDPTTGLPTGHDLKNPAIVHKHRHALRADHAMNVAAISALFHLVDKDGSKTITPRELWRFTKGRVLLSNTNSNAAPLTGTESQPTEVRIIPVTDDPTKLMVVWMSSSTSLDDHVEFGTSPTTLNEKNVHPGTVHTYSVDGGLWTSLPIHMVVMENLAPRTRYFYRVGSDAAGFSDVFNVTTLPDPNQPLEYPMSLLTFGDQGVIIMGTVVTGWMEQALSTGRVFDLTLVVGDLAYAGVGHISDGEYEPTWDAWEQTNQPITASIPHLFAVGNHEAYFDYAAYKQRFGFVNPTGNGTDGFFWATRVGPALVIAMSTEHDYTPGSQQYEFLSQQLQRACKDNRVNGGNLDYVLFSGHRPFYSASQTEFDSHSPGSKMLQALEGLLNQPCLPQVVSLTGHIHAYERSAPVFNGTVVKQCQGNVCTRPLGAPIYVVQGTAGALQNDKWVDPIPAWSSFRAVSVYGFGVLTIYPNSTLHYEFLSGSNQQVIDELWIM